MRTTCERPTVSLLGNLHIYRIKITDLTRDHKINGHSWITNWTCPLFQVSHQRFITKQRNETNLFYQHDNLPTAVKKNLIVWYEISRSYVVSSVILHIDDRIVVPTMTVTVKTSFVLFFHICNLCLLESLKGQF